MSRVPFHAAGMREINPSESLVKMAISSYASTIKVLTYSKERPIGISRPHLTLVGMPETPGHASLPGAKQETAVVRDIASSCIQTIDFEDPSTEIVSKSFADDPDKGDAGGNR